jgi:hypothetical protein
MHIKTAICTLKSLPTVILYTFLNELNLYATD